MEKNNELYRQICALLKVAEARGYLETTEGEYEHLKRIVDKLEKNGTIDGAEHGRLITDLTTYYFAYVICTEDH